MENTKAICIFLFFVLLTSVLSPKNTLKIGPYTGYFSPQGADMKKYYEGEDIIYGLKMGVRIWRGFYVWLSGMQFQKTSQTTLLADATTLTLNPINLSLRYTLNLGTINPYLEGGYSYILYKEISDIGNVKGETRGYSVDAGIEFKLSAAFVIDLGVRYSQAEIDTTIFDGKMGGTQAGAALLVVF
jgi:opacity protein-like surface antigen